MLYLQNSLHEEFTNKVSENLTYRLCKILVHLLTGCYILYSSYPYHNEPLFSKFVEARGDFHCPSSSTRQDSRKRLQHSKSFGASFFQDKNSRNQCTCIVEYCPYLKCDKYYQGTFTYRLLRSACPVLLAACQRTKMDIFYCYR